MTRKLFISLGAGLLALLSPTGCRAAPVDLHAFVHAEDNSFSWSKGEQKDMGGVQVTDLRMRSQTWRGIAWDHTVQLFRPAAARHPSTCLLLITGGSPSPESTLLAVGAVASLSAPVAVLYNIPNQPLFDGMREDDLIAHTFDEYFKSGDPTWPLLLPMTKSAVRAMDAVQQFVQGEKYQPIQGFVVTGASKRGWTTYLTAAVDPRVKGMAPIVFDNLNFSRQMPRQLELWGRYSSQIDDYTRRGLQQKMETERGRELMRAVDPWFHRQRYTMPKLLIHGSNDPYWATDAASVYWNDLPGPKSLLTVPNEGHGIRNLVTVLAGLAAFFHAVAEGRPFPQMSEEVSLKGGRVQLRVKADTPVKEISVWTVRAEDTDFRNSQWTQAPMKKEGEWYIADIALPEKGGLGLFAEGTFEVDGDAFRLSTPSRVFRPGQSD